MESGRSWSYEVGVERRRERRRKGPQLYDLTQLEEDTRHLRNYEQGLPGVEFY